MHAHTHIDSVRLNCDYDYDSGISYVDRLQICFKVSDCSDVRWGSYVDPRGVCYLFYMAVYRFVHGVFIC